MQRSIGVLGQLSMEVGLLGSRGCREIRKRML